VRLSARVEVSHDLSGVADAVGKDGSSARDVQGGEGPSSDREHEAMPPARVGVVSHDLPDTVDTISSRGSHWAIEK